MEETEIVIDEVFPADSSKTDSEPALLLHALLDKSVGIEFCPSGREDCSPLTNSKASRGKNSDGVKVLLRRISASEFGQHLVV
jgi:hypothetical protein